MEPTDPTQDKPVDDTTTATETPVIEAAPAEISPTSEAVAPTPIPTTSPEAIVAPAAATPTSSISTPSSTPAVAASEVMEFAGIGRRFFALLLDGIVFALVFGGLDYALGGNGGYDVNEYNELVATGISTTVLQIISVAVTAAYHTYFIGSMGQTPGKRIMGIKVVTTSGERPSYGIALMRYLVSLISGAVFLLGYIWAFFSKEKQTWHDKAAHTFVVKA